MEQFNIRQLLAGIGILIFGMHIFEESIKTLGGNTLKRLLQKYTNSRLKSILAGIFGTALLQSSSLVSLILLGFVGAGVLQLSNAIGVIIGANIGTTVSSIVVAGLGFGEFKISAFALPIIAIGGIVLIFAKNKKLIFWSRLLVGFGLLFLGLDFMKESVDVIKDTFSISDYAHTSLYTFFLIGAIVTAIIQSSSAVGVMTLAAISGGIIDFPSSVAIIMGANIGTTITGVIASLGGKRTKKQLALAQVCFNIFVSLIGWLFFWHYISFVNDILGLKNNLVMANAMVNLSFNFSVALLVSPFLGLFTRLVKKILPDIQHNGLKLAIDRMSQDKDDFAEPIVTPAQIIALKEDTEKMIRYTITYNCYVWGYDFDGLAQGNLAIIHHRYSNDHHKNDYILNKDRADRLLQFIHNLKQYNLSNHELVSIDNVQLAIVACIRSMKAIKNIRHNIQSLRSTNDTVRKELYESLLKDNIHLYKELVNIVAHNGQKYHIDGIYKLMNDLKNWYNYYATTIARLEINEESDEVDIASLINVHRELYDSVLALIRAIEYIFLTKEETQLLDNLN